MTGNETWERHRQIAIWIDRLPETEAYGALVAADGDVDALLLQRATYGSSDQATNALAVLDARKPPKLARRLADLWHKVAATGNRAAMADAWARLGDRSVVPEIALFLDEDPAVAVRVRLARSLGMLGDARAVDALGRAAIHPAAPLSLESVRALTVIGSPRAIPALLQALERAGPDVTLAVAAVSGLSRVRARSSVELLAGLLARSGAASLREACAMALGKIGDPRAVPALIDALTDPSNSVFRACENSLRAITGANPPLQGEDIPKRTQDAWRLWQKTKDDR